MPYVSYGLAGGFSFANKLAAISQTAGAIVDKLRGVVGADERFEVAKRNMHQVIDDTEGRSKAMIEAAHRAALTLEQQKQQQAAINAGQSVPMVVTGGFTPPIVEPSSELQAGFGGFDMGNMLPIALVLGAAFLLADLKKAPRKRSR